MMNDNYKISFSAFLQKLLALAGFLFLVCGAQAVAANLENQYQLSTGDRIHIKVYNEEDLTVETELDASGVVNYSYVGPIRISGKSTREVEKLISDKLRNGYLNNPVVSVSIIEYRPFFINGEVKKPGGYSYQPGLTLEKAISLAGGMTERASKSKMYVIRETEGALAKRKKIRLGDLVRPGDIVTIDEGFF